VEHMNNPENKNLKYRRLMQLIRREWFILTSGWFNT